MSFIWIMCLLVTSYSPVSVKAANTENSTLRSYEASESLLLALEAIFEHEDGAKVLDYNYNDVTNQFINENVNYYFSKQYDMIKEDIKINRYTLIREEPQQNDEYGTFATIQNTTKTIYLYKLLEFTTTGILTDSIEYNVKFLMSMTWNMNTGVATGNNSSVTITDKTYGSHLSPLFVSSAGVEKSIYQTYSIKTSYAYKVYITYKEQGVVVVDKKLVGSFRDTIIMDSSGEYTLTRI